MRKATKLLTLVLAALMIMSVVSIPASAAFTDVSVENEALYEAVELLSTLNIAKGTTETTFGPDELVTRQQMAAFIFRLMKAGKSIEGGTNETTFADLDDATFYYMISWANQSGIITGRNSTTFDPKGNITLQDAYTMLVRALGYEKDEKLPYPFGYINQAEELGLDKNLPSTVNYGDKLTRGDVAILLANAFYADMNKVTSEYGWISKGTGRFDSNNTEIVEYAYVLKEKVATVAKDVFGVQTEKFLVTATSNNGINGVTGLANAAAIKTSQTQDVETIKGIRYDENGYVLNNGNAFEFKFADLGLAGSSDDYFLDEITLFVKKADKLADDKIVAAKSNLIKKTVAAKDVVIERSTNEEKEYYVGGVKDPEAKKTMTGFVDFAGTKAYLDGVNAPYSYKQLSDKYNANGIINKPAVKFIEIGTVAHDTIGTRFTYTSVANTNFDNTLTALTQQQNPAYDGLDAAITGNNTLKRIYAGGLAEYDVYDSNGDGYAEYVAVKNYDALKIEDANGNRVKLTKLANNAQAYIENKNIVIKGDYKANANVLVYAKATTAALIDTKYVEVKSGLDTVDSTVYSVVNEGTRPNTNFVDYTVTLKSGEKLSSVDANLKYDVYTAQYPSVPGTAVKFLVKDGIIVATLGATAGTFNTTANYAIVLPYTTNVANKYTNPGIINNTAFGNTQYVFEVSGVADGKFVSQLFVNVLVDGKVVAVKLGDTIYTKARYSNNAYSYNANNTVEALEIAERNNITEATLVEAILQAEYANQFVTYTAAADGAFVLKALDFTGNLTNALTEDAVAVSFNNVTLKNYANTVYEFVTNVPAYRINMQNYSKFVIETTDANTGKPVYTVYTAATLPKFTNTTFTTLYGIMVNNTTSTTLENVGILYGKTNALAAAGTKDLQIVVGSTTRATTSGSEVVLSLLNPKTGVVTSDVLATTAVQNAAIGKVVELRDDGKAYNYTVAQNTYGAANMFETTFSYGNDSFDANSNFLTLDNIANAGNFVVNADTTYLWYTNKNTYQMVDATILDADYNPYDSALGNGQNGNFQIFVVADENNNTAMDPSIKVVKTIIVTKNTTDLATAN